MPRFYFCALLMLCAISYTLGAGIDVNPDKRGWHIELKLDLLRYALAQCANRVYRD